MKNINQDIKSKQFKRIYILTGDEHYLRQQYRHRLIDAMLPEGDTMNLSIYDGKITDFNGIRALADTYPFFSDRRVIVLNNTGVFAEKVPDDFADYLAQLPDTTTLIFDEDQVDKRSKLYKAAAKVGYVAELARPKEKQLVLWLAGICKKDNKRVRESTINHFIATVAPDMNSMVTEMEKVICYVGERDYIEDADIDAVCTVHVENKIFDMVRATADGNVPLAMKLYEDLLTLREPPLRILALLTRQFTDLLEIRELAAKGLGPDVIAERTKKNKFAVSKNYSLARSFSEHDLKRILESCLAYDEDFKNGRIDDKIAIELLIVELSK